MLLIPGAVRRVSCVHAAGSWDCSRKSAAAAVATLALEAIYPVTSAVVGATARRDVSEDVLVSEKDRRLRQQDDEIVF